MGLNAITLTSVGHYEPAPLYSVIFNVGWSLGAVCKCRTFGWSLLHKCFPFPTRIARVVDFPATASPVSEFPFPVVMNDGHWSPLLTGPETATVLSVPDILLSTPVSHGHAFPTLPMLPLSLCGARG